MNSSILIGPTYSPDASSWDSEGRLANSARALAQPRRLFGRKMPVSSNSLAHLR